VWTEKRILHRNTSVPRVLTGAIYMSVNWSASALEQSSLTYPVRHAQAPYCLRPSVSTIFFDIISQTARFSGKKNTDDKIRGLISSTILI
jgi:hypothetical protein